MPSSLVTLPVYCHLSPMMPGGGNVPSSVSLSSFPSGSTYLVTSNTGISTCGGLFGISVWMRSYTYVVMPSSVVTLPVYCHLSPMMPGGGNVPSSVSLSSLPSVSTYLVTSNTGISTCGGSFGISV